MAKEFLINVSPSETRMAVLEDGKLVELSKESHTAQRHIGNIYRGKVENVLPGMQAAFIDIGMEKNAFLFIDDLHPETGDNGSASIATFSGRPELSCNWSKNRWVKRARW